MVQSVLLYGSEKWVLKLRMQRVLGRFHHKVDHRLTGQQLQKVRDIVWFYLPLEDGMSEVGLEEVETYVSCRYNTVEQYIMTKTILDLCLEAKRRPGPIVEMLWWDQPPDSLCAPPRAGCN